MSALTSLGRLPNRSAPIQQFFVAVSGIATIVLIAIRGISVLWPSIGAVPPRLAWIAFAGSVCSHSRFELRCEHVYRNRVCSRKAHRDALCTDDKTGCCG
jgi:hypothetical protein